MARRTGSPALADWYADPFERHELRYWNGVGWTSQVRDGGADGLDTPGVHRPVRRFTAEQVRTARVQGLLILAVGGAAAVLAWRLGHLSTELFVMCCVFAVRPFAGRRRLKQLLGLQPPDPDRPTASS